MLKMDTRMCQSPFISCNKGTTVVGDVDNEGVCACVGVGDLWGVSTFLSILL